jgi:uncharacterized secreted protein with C-terminal beta-propeller domain
MMNSELKWLKLQQPTFSTNFSDSYYYYTTVLAFNLQNLDQKPSNMTIMMGGAGTIYVSQNNIYVTYPSYTPQLLKDPTTTGGAPIGILPQENKEKLQFMNSNFRTLHDF